MKKVQRRILLTVLNIVLTSLAAWLAVYLTNKLLGREEEEIA